MIVNDDINNIKVIYIKIPKTGGTTISSNIWRKYNVKRSNKTVRSTKKHYKYVINLNFLPKFKLNRNECGWHSPYFKIKQYLEHKNLLIEDFSKFSIIREPVSRFKSQYKHVFSTYGDLNIRKSIDYYFDCVSNNDKRLKVKSKIFSKKQTFWLNDENGLIPEDMKLFTTKTINDKKTLDYLNYIMGFEFDTEKRKNVSKIKKEIIVSSELRSKIENFYSEDCELYEKINKSI